MLLHLLRACRAFPYTCREVAGTKLKGFMITWSVLDQVVVGGLIAGVLDNNLCAQSLRLVDEQVSAGGS